MTAERAQQILNRSAGYEKYTLEEARLSLNWLSIIIEEAMRHPLPDDFQLGGLKLVEPEQETPYLPEDETHDLHRTVPPDSRQREPDG